MRRTAAGIAAPLLAALAIAGPFASAGSAAPVSLHSATASPPAACALLDDLAAQLGPVTPLLGAPLAGLTGPAQGFAARSDQPAGVPTAEVVQVTDALRDQLAVLPHSIEVLLGQTALGDLIDTLDALVADLGAPVTGGPQSSGSTKPTPVQTDAPASSSSRSSTSFSGSTSTGSSSPASSPSSAAVPDVPVGDPLTLAPLALPDFGFQQAFEPSPVELAAAPAMTDEQKVAEVVDALSHQGRSPELAVVAVLSVLLIAAAGVAQLQAKRHEIPD